MRDSVQLHRIHRNFYSVYSVRVIPQNILLLMHNMVSLKARINTHCDKLLHKLIHNVIDCQFLLERVHFHVPSPDPRIPSDCPLEEGMRRAPIPLMVKNSDLLLSNDFFS